MVEVRRAEPGEHEDIARLTLEAYAEHERHMPPHLWDDYVAELSDVEGRAAAGTILVAVEAGQLLGVADLIPSTEDPSRAYFRYLAVAGPARGLGIGRLLMEDATARSVEDGVRTLEWRTASFMEGARRLYERIGHEPVEAIEVDAGVVLYRYRLELDGRGRPLRGS